MARYSVAAAKDSFSGLIAKAQAGEEVIITRHGKPAVEIRAVQPEAPDREAARAAHAWLKQRREARPPVSVTSAQLLRLDDEESGH
jgi:antitoxin (DNA-binding transcriptional repressor) of toxin-antitoxin stability system